MLAADFADLTPDQYDALVLVLYSDVAEWYTQQRQEVDRPWHSFHFLVTGLGRVFREIEPARTPPVRKKIRAAAQIYWNGEFYPGIATEMGSRGLRIDLEDCPPELSALRRSTVPVGILLSQTFSDPNPTQLLAQVESIGTRQMTLVNGNGTRLATATASLPMELSFPQALDSQQARQIRQLLKQLE